MGVTGADASFSDAASDGHYRAVLDALDEGVVVMGGDMTVRIANPAAERILGVPLSQLVGMSALEAFGEVLREDGTPWAEEELPAFTVTAEVPVRGAVMGIRRLDGRLIWLSVGLRELEPGGYLCTFSDITEVRAVEAALRRERRQLAAAQVIARVGSWSWDPIAGTVEWSEEMCRLHGLAGPPRRPSVNGYLRLVHPDDRVRVATFMSSIARSPRDFETTYRLRRADGSEIDVEVRAYAAPHGALEGTVQDITERLRFERRLRHLADHDPLTGLLNRRGFEAELERHATRGRRYGPEGGLLLLDLDHFKQVNDSFGHAAGDALIADVAAAIRTRVRESDVLARMGGDEFAVLLPRGGAADLRRLAEDLLAGLGALTLPGRGRVRRLTGSVGGALFGPDDTAETVLAHADQAMYVAKDAGRSRYAAWGEGTGGEHGQARAAWADCIERALQGGRFELWAQPIRDLRSGEVLQHELLLRLRSESGELIAPADFLPVAERIDLLTGADRWVVRAAGEALRLAARPLVLNVNLAAVSLSDEEVLAEIERALAGRPAGSLVFDIAETAAASDVSAVRRFGERVRDLGACLALDDFGAGFGSFHWLRHLPCDYLKIDGDYVRGCRSDPGDRAVIGAIVELAHGLGKRTVAEAVPDARTMTLLRREGVDLGQGFHLGRPEPLPERLTSP